MEIYTADIEKTGSYSGYKERRFWASSSFPHPCLSDP